MISIMADGYEISEDEARRLVGRDQVRKVLFTLKHHPEIECVTIYLSVQWQQSRGGQAIRTLTAWRRVVEDAA